MIIVNYDWTDSQCKQLLDDIVEVGTNKEMNAHFIGSMVHVHDDVYTTSRIKELTIIDGQQRLTTLTLIYLVLYRLAKRLNDKTRAEEIHETYLINKFAPEQEKLKLRPTENNDKALKYLLRGDDDEGFNEYSRIVENFRYFRDRITKEDYESILEGLSKLMFVEIALDRTKDNPQRIFESLNSTGLELSQADLIRNYILMGLKREDQKKIYQNYWEIIEKFARDETSQKSKVSSYIRDYLTLENKKIPNQNKVYVEFKAKYPTSSVDELEFRLSEIKNLARHYNKLINPKKEPDEEISSQLKYINRLEITVAFPFLIKVYDDYAREVIDKSTFLKILDLIQSFTLRRVILGLPRGYLNKIFMDLYGKVDPTNYLYSIQKSLIQRSGQQRFPEDKEVIDALKSKDVYNFKRKDKIYLLERLENFENKEPVVIEGNPDITIEHIFPRNPDPKWRVDLGSEEYTFIKENYLHTIGNLTLSGNNGKLGNKPFEEKRGLEDAGYKDSRLWMNRYLSTLDKWGRKEIEERFKLIAERFLKIWEYPNIKIKFESDNGEVNIFDAEDPTRKKLEYAIFFDEKIKVSKVTELYIEVFKRLFKLVPERFFKTELGRILGLTEKSNKLRRAIDISHNYFIEAHSSSKQKFDKLKRVLEILGVEDELYIKYED